VPPRRLLLPIAAVAALALPAPAMACDGADAQGASPALEATTVCLLNVERAQQGLGPLTARDDLASAARAHAQDMVARGYFAHDAPDGTTLLDRLRTAGWLPASGYWTAGEDIAWGSGRLGSPREIVTAWMNSAGHRANILGRDFDEVGVSVAAGAPGTGADGASTFVADFGARDTEPAAAPLAGAVPPAVAPAAGETTRRAAAHRCARSARLTRGKAQRRAAVRRCAAAARRARP
jgi:uncharacterized protein YkwD